MDEYEPDFRVEKASAGDDSPSILDPDNQLDVFSIGDEYEMGEETLTPGVDYDESFMNVLEMVGWSGCVLLMFVLFNVGILMGRVPWLPVPDTMFWWYLLTFFGTFSVVTVAGGAMHRYCGVNISYTRKIAHFFSFFLPFGLFALFPFKKSVTTYVLTFCAAFISFIPLMDGIRNIPSMWILRLAYASFDRREDRPLTLMWAVTQNLMVYVVMLSCALVLDEVLHEPVFVLIPLIVTGFGDGFAEIVGRAYGRHKYKTAAMCAQKQYTRSIEGSMVIVFSGVVVIAVMFAAGVINVAQLVTGLIVIPVPMAVAEAKSPHSWDNPFLLLVGGLLSIGVALVPRIPWSF